LHEILFWKHGKSKRRVTKKRFPEPGNYNERTLYLWYPAIGIAWLAKHYKYSNHNKKRANFLRQAYFFSQEKIICDNYKNKSDGSDKRGYSSGILSESWYFQKRIINKNKRKPGKNSKDHGEYEFPIEYEMGKISGVEQISGDEASISQ
jgi:hypothetical protein